MIEIPDLDDLRNYVDAVDPELGHGDEESEGHFMEENQGYTNDMQGSSIAQHMIANGNPSMSQLEQIEEGVHNLTVNGGLTSSSDRESETSEVQAWRSRQTIEYPETSNDMLDSNISLAHTNNSYDIMAQVVEYDTAEVMPLQNFEKQAVFNENLDQVAYENKVQLVPAVHNGEEPLKLQDPPNFQYSRFDSLKENNKTDDTFDIKGSQPSLSNKASYSIFTQTNSPATHGQVDYDANPSPQLPPPMSATSMKRLTLSNGEEFSSIRKGLATESKTTAEYTLHIIFTQFVRHAERKLNLCLDYSLDEEPPIIDLLAEGVDPQFDHIVQSLGYIARRKPKPVIDSVMFWRKSKSEVASMAAEEVERTLNAAKNNLSKLSSMSSNDEDSSSGQNSNSSMGRSKRSLSLMRSKSISKITGTHRRHQSTSEAMIRDVSISPKGNKKKSNENALLKLKAYHDEQIAQIRETAIQADRKSLASIYILCRVLIEVVKQASNEIIGDDLGYKLEEIVYTQLKTTDPVSTSQSLVRSANWNLFAEILGYMSVHRFLSVSDRFIADFEKIPANVKQEDEPRLHLLIYGMKYLKLTNYPLESFEESADFLLSLAKFFERTTNESLIFAYCEVLSHLMLPLANILTAEANHPTWVEAIEKIYGKAYKIWNNAIKSNQNQVTMTPGASQNGTSISNTLGFTNSWAYSIHLMTSSLTVSRKELFSDAWFNLIEDNQFKLKPKVEIEDKCTFIVCAARLIWVYIYRIPDTLNNTMKRLDQFFQILFFNSNSNNKKHQWLSSDLRLIEGLVELIRVVGYQHLNYTLDEVILRLLKSAFNGSTLENMMPEKLMVVIKGYLAILEDREFGKHPEFPTDSVLAKRLSSDDKNLKKKNSRVESLDIADFSFAAKSSSNAISHEEICKSFATLLTLLDTQYGSDVWSLDNSNQSTPLNTSFSISQSTFSNFHFGIDFTYSTKGLNIEMFATLIQAVPWTMVPIIGEKNSLSGIQFKSVVEILTRNTLHADYKIANESINALKKLAARKNPTNMITLFANIAFQFSDKPNPNHDIEYMYSSEFHKLLRIYVELLNCWYQELNKAAEYSKSGESSLIQDDEAMSNDILNDLYQVNYNTESSVAPKKKRNDEFEWKAIITVIEEIEGNGLFFLCSQDSKTRHYGISILKLVEQFDQALYKMTDLNAKSLTPVTSTPSSQMTHSRSSSKYVADVDTRLIHVLQNTDFLNLIQPIRKELSVPEKTRLSKLKNKKSILMRLAESDHGIDSTIWFRLYPKVLDIFFEKCPMPVAICRSIVCVKMVQMHEAIYDFSESYKSYTSMFSRSTSGTPPEVLVNQWKLYLIFSCCSLTSTNEQKISFPTQPTHGRKKSMQMYIQHQKITSAKSIFRMALPLLKSQQSMVREAVISGVSCININIFKTLLENVPISLNDWNVSKRDPAEDRLRIEIIHVLANITTRFRDEFAIYSDEWMIANLVSVVKNVKAFLSLNEIQTDVFFQKLRLHFSVLLENVFIGLQNNTILNKWIPFEARIGCFNFLKEWCELGASKYISEERYNLMIRRMTNQKDATTAIAILEVEKKALQLAALSCMSVLCSGPVKQQIEGIGNTAVMSFDVSGLMNWVKALFESDNPKIQEIGRIALRNILTANIDNEEVYEEVVKECYSSHDSLKTTEYYFTIFVDVYLTNHKLGETPFDVICLASFLVGNDNYQVRFASMKLLKFLEENFFHGTTIDKFTESVCSKTKVIYKKALYEISAHWASVYPDGAFNRISCLTMFFNLVDNSSRRDILSCLLPWMQMVELNERDNFTAEPNNAKLNSVQISLDSPSIMVLNNLFEITVKFSSKISNEVEALWMALGGNATNFDKIIEFLMGSCLERKNPLFVEYSQQIIDYLSYSQANKLYIIEKLINNIQPKTLVPPQPAANIIFEDRKEFPYIANLWKVVPASEKDAAFSLGQLSTIFLVDLFAATNEKMLEHLPLLLHVSFSLLDHYLPIVQEQACTLLVHLIKALAPLEPKTKDTVDILRKHDYHRSLWVYDDLNNDKKGARTPRSMDSLVRNVLEIFTPFAPTLQEDWSRVSLSWATTCAVRHIACRSFQLFRSLLSFLDQSMLKDMLHRLSNTISDESLDIQGFAMQILMTLNAITAELDSEKLIDYPQLFWSSVACLSTIHEQEFTEVLSTMSKFVSKIDLDSPDTVSCLISTFPPKWEGKFEGLQHLIMTGLRSANLWEPCIKFLDKLNQLKDSEIIGKGDSRLVMVVVANLPRYLHALEEKSISKEIEASALNLSEMAKNNNKPSLARILESLSKNKFRSKKDFLEQCLSTIRNDFFPEHEAQVLVLLLGILSNKTRWVKIETMSLLKRIFQFVGLERDEFVGVGADLISPLLRLLLTNYAEPALEVLDEAVVISGSQLDKDVLRMSLGNSSMKKEYEKTATLFGIPDESGWSIPMQAVTAASTRNNVHAVFLTCTVTSVINEEDEQNKDEEIQFHMDDFYDPSTDHGDTVSVSVDEPDASLSNVWAALDDFDSFFTKDANNNVSVNVGNSLFNGHRENHHTHSASVDTRYSNSSDLMAPMDSAPQVYDKKASVILNRSLARTHSNMSFKNSLTDSIGTNLLGVHGSSLVGKRSYIPFRNNKTSTKAKSDAFNTPVMPMSHTFDSPSNSSPFRSSAISPSTATTFNDTSSPNKSISTEMNAASSNTDHNRFENLIGSNKKKYRRSVKYSPNSSSNSVSPDLHSHYWHLNKSGNSSLNYMNTPPSTAPVDYISAAKVREKRKSSQRHK